MGSKVNNANAREERGFLLSFFHISSLPLGKGWVSGYIYTASEGSDPTQEPGRDILREPEPRVEEGAQPQLVVRREIA